MNWEDDIGTNINLFRKLLGYLLPLYLLRSSNKTALRSPFVRSQDDGLEDFHLLEAILLTYGIAGLQDNSIHIFALANFV